MTELPTGRFYRRATFEVNMTPEQRAMFDDICIEGHFENQERIDFLERITGMPFEMIEGVEEYR